MSNTSRAPHGYDAAFERSDTDSSYDEFIARKSAIAPPVGMIDVPPLGDYLFPFQSDIVGWMLRRGKAANMSAVGTGKTREAFEFAAQASAYLDAKIGRPDVLIVAPLGVTAQTAREIQTLGGAANYCKGPDDVRRGSMAITNYDRLERFDVRRFGTVVFDESSIIKNSESKTRARVIASVKDAEFIGSFTATAAPNDRKEFGSQSELLGVMTEREMLSEFFVHDAGENTWRLKGHAEQQFWKWVASWGCVLTKPSDLGYADTGYNLPALHIHDHIIGSSMAHDRIIHADVAQLSLIPRPARGLKKQAKARRITLDERVNAAVEIVLREPNEQWLVWCALNDESDELIARIGAAIPGAVAIRGADSAEKKEAAAFGFATGSVRVLVSKVRIFGYGLNFQNCARSCFVGVTHSFEDVHQALGRFHRFGQKRECDAHFVFSELEGAVRENLRRKQLDFEKMANEMRSLVAGYVKQNVRGSVRDITAYNPTVDMTIPEWLVSEAS